MGKVDLTYFLDIDKKSAWHFISADQTVKNSFPFIQELGDFHCYKKYFTQRKDLESYYLSYTRSGIGVLEYDNTIYTIQPMQAIWIDCKKYQYYYTEPEHGFWNQIWVHFYGPSTEKYYELFLERNNGKNLVTLPPDNSVTDKIEKLIGMYKNGNNNSYTDIFTSSIIVDLMTQCILATSDTGQFIAAPDCVRDAMYYIQNNYKKNISLDSLSNKYSVNKYYFQKLFKKHLGITPNSYLMTIRMNKAKELLRTTTLQISEISREVGIDNVSHFINIFKTNEGITPLKYANTWYWK